MGKLQKRLVVVVLALVALVGLAWVFVVPGEIKTIVGFLRWHDAHLRTSGQVPREPAGSSIYYEEYGKADGPPVVVLHGGLVAIMTMGAQIEALADANYRVIAIELRAHGKSPNTAPAVPYELLTDDIVGVLDALKIERVDLVGWSDGGIVGFDLARRYPDRIRRLVAFGANRVPEDADPAMVQEFKDLTADSSALAPLRFMYQKRSPTPEKWPEFFEQVRARALTQPQWSLEQLSTIRAPVLLINGEHDIVLPARATEIKNAIPGARLEIIKGEPHEVPLANPHAVNPLMLSFLGA